ncbi:MAG: hypothetical protein ACTSPB_05215 [Candidatus Thorarchaeota archaeon]
MFGHNQWDTKSFNAFSDESVTKTDDPSIQAISQDIEIPIWTFTETTDSNGHPKEKFERTFDTPFGSVTQHKEVSHPPPFGVTIHNTLTTDTETLETTLTQDNVKDPFTESEDETVRDYHVWELSGLDEWLVPEEEEEEEEETEDETIDESSPTITSSHPTESKPLFCMTCPAGYILGGIGLLAGAYMYFIIRNPQAYVQATAIKTGGGLLGQLMD